MSKPKKPHLLRTLFLSLNLIAAIALIGTYLPAYIAPSVSPFISLFGLIYPILLYINLGFVLFWLIFRYKLALVSVIVILAGYNNLMNNFHFNLFKGGVYQGTTLKVLTYNVQTFGLTEGKGEGESNRNKILYFLKNENPHITCLQEYRSEGKTRYEPLKNMKDTLNVGTYYYESYFSPKYNQLSGLVIFSKFSAVDKGKLKFKGSRTFGIYADLLIGNDTVRVYNIHLASIQLLPSDIEFVVSAGQEEKGAFAPHLHKIYDKLTDAFILREKQIDYLTRQLDSCRFTVIMCGDFNDTPSSYVYNQIISKLKDSFKEKGKGISTSYAGEIPFLRIDYIFTSKPVNTFRFQRYKVGFSDHFPVSAMITI
ncbi:MAG: endonuclease/exonuclease/phosphatase family protein [Chlorobi bacterium]|nr:endonuclease/exonuclease/phosphatase family protein [Chlorobiota bacterium]